MPWRAAARADFRQSFDTGNESQPYVGAELLSLCQTAMEDGRLSARELQSLRTLREGRMRDQLAELPYIGQILDQILHTGQVMPGQLRTLQQTLEPCLPAELTRRRAKLRVVDPDWQPGEVEDTGDRLRNEVLASARFTVAGCLSDRHASTIRRHARAGQPVLLVREPDDANPHAIRVCTASGKPIGFVPAQHAKRLAPLLDRGARYRAHLTHVLAGEVAPVLLVQAYLYAADAELGAATASTRKMTRSRLAGAVWLLRLVVGLAIAAAVAFVLKP
ncbi:MAG: HIRAN domain-containing protein [Pseudomonadota bacterium]|jgi:HIRAN domain.|nr:MAG: hypothetical protein DIU56_13430 [Pseudomonadota bacterium]